MSIIDNVNTTVTILLSYGYNFHDSYTFQIRKGLESFRKTFCIDLNPCIRVHGIGVVHLYLGKNSAVFTFSFELNHGFDIKCSTFCT